MAFTPNLDVCFETCGLIKFVDNTNLYSISNTSGWGESNSVESANLTAATIVVTDAEGEIVFTYDVLDQVSDPVTGDIIYEAYEYALDDGEFTVTYTLTFGATVYEYVSSFLNSCNFECCIDSLISTIPSKICANGCDTDYIDEVLTIEGLLYGYMCSAVCEKTIIRAEIEKRLKRFCDFQCNCN